jgi:hypothetical protein
MKQNHKSKFTDQELIDQYALTPTLSKISKYFNVPDVTVWRRAKKLGLEFKVGGANAKCPLEEILQGMHPQYQTNKLKHRMINNKIIANECSGCGISDWMGKPLTLHLDHIDGNNHNHVRDNLRLLCPNCHSLTDTWCGKNK